jgi:hypothetical protein
MTTEEITERRDQIRAYLHAARRALEAAALNLEEGYDGCSPGQRL